MKRTMDLSEQLSWRRAHSSHYHLASTFLLLTHILFVHESVLMSADEGSRPPPSCLPKMPARPLMAFYMGHINLSSAPLKVICVYGPNSFSVCGMCNWFMSSRNGAGGQ